MQESGTLEATHSTVHEILTNPDFQALVGRKTFVSVGLTLATMAVYYGFIFLVAFHKAVLAKKITENITLGIPVGIGVILITCVFTGIYVVWANKNYDPAVKAFKNKMGHD